MASPQLRPKTRVLVPRDWSSESATLRLLSAERPEEIFPILLEEIVKLGFARALVRLPNDLPQRVTLLGGRAGAPAGLSGTSKFPCFQETAIRGTGLPRVRHARLCDTSSCRTAKYPSAETSGEAARADGARQWISNAPLQIRTLLQPHAGHGRDHFPPASRDAKHGRSGDSYRQPAPGNHPEPRGGAILSCS